MQMQPSCASSRAPRALQLLGRHARHGPALPRAWQAVCQMAETDPEAALNAWFDFLCAALCVPGSVPLNSCTMKSCCHWCQHHQRLPFPCLLLSPPVTLKGQADVGSGGAACAVQGGGNGF